jgi:hypothetical protein
LSRMLGIPASRSRGMTSTTARSTDIDRTAARIAAGIGAVAFEPRSVTTGRVLGYSLRSRAIEPSDNPGRELDGFDATHTLIFP